jgi:D-hexose-6-phosphate mutarotase
VRSFDVNWPQIAVHGADVTAFTRHEGGSVLWLSVDGGANWTVSRR